MQAKNSAKIELSCLYWLGGCGILMPILLEVEVERVYRLVKRVVIKKTIDDRYYIECKDGKRC